MSHAAATVHPHDDQIDVTFSGEPDDLAIRRALAQHGLGPELLLLVLSQDLREPIPRIVLHAVEETERKRGHCQLSGKALVNDVQQIELRLERAGQSNPVSHRYV